MNSPVSSGDHDRKGRGKMQAHCEAVAGTDATSHGSLVRRLEQTAPRGSPRGGLLRVVLDRADRRMLPRCVGVGRLSVRALLASAGDAAGRERRPDCDRGREEDRRAGALVEPAANRRGNRAAFSAARPARAHPRAVLWPQSRAIRRARRRAGPGHGAGRRGRPSGRRARPRRPGAAAQAGRRRTGGGDSDRLAGNLGGT